MPILKTNRRLALVIAGAVTVLTALGATLAASASATPSPMLKSVSATFVSQAGIQLRAPTGSAAVIQHAAQQTALQEFPGSTVRETVLTNFSDTHHVPAISTLAWAVSLTVPSDFPAPSGPAPARSHMKPSYLVVFINATTGTFIEAISGGKV
jgi:hypothetical protein